MLVQRFRGVKFGLVILLAVAQLHGLFAADLAPKSIEQSLFMPKIESDLDRVRFLLWAHDHLPTLYSLTSDYQVDLFSLLQEEERLVEALKNNPEYQAAVRNRPELLSIT